MPDAAVAAAAKRLVWVEIDKNQDAQTPKRFNVVSYPTLLVLNDKEEKIHRIAGFREPKEYLGEMDEALRRFDLCRKGKEWDSPPDRSQPIFETGQTDLLPAPSGERLNGIALLGKDLWVVQGGAEQVLYRLDPRKGEVRDQYPLKGIVNGLCTDGKVLYALEYGWTSGAPIHVIDPATGKVVREIVTEANKSCKSSSAQGIAFAGGRLYVWDGG